MDTKRLHILGEAPIISAIIKMTLPVIAGMIVQILYNLVDTFFIGQLNDPNQLAAANLAMPLFMIVMGIAGIVGIGGSSFISRMLGNKEYDRANAAFSICLYICLGLGILITALGIIFLTPICYMLGASTNTFPYVYDYVSVLLYCSIITVFSFSLSQLLRAEGATTLSMIGMLIGTVVNIILDPIFIFVFNMGIKGVAIATVIGGACSAVFYAICYMRKKTVVRYGSHFNLFDKDIIKQIFFIGTPATFNQLLMSFSFIIANNLAATYGDLVVAGLGVAMKLISIGTFVFMGFASGCQPLVGYNYGAKNFHRVKDVIKYGAVITAIFGLLLLIIFGFFGRSIAAVFMPSNEAVIELATQILSALMLGLPFIGGIMLCVTTIQSMGKALGALILSVSRQGLVFIPLLLILNSLFGYSGFVYAQPITDFITFVMASIILLKTLSKDALLHEQASESLPQEV